jgi:membrane associated rhomboid family serine protease
MTETCYRHPDRETAVSCSNCGRPICPDCMTPTSVGMRCPECSRQTTKVKAGAAAFGRSTRAPATYALIAINVVFFLAEIAGGGALSAGGGGTVIDNLGLFGPAVANGEVYRIVTAGFLHLGPIHLLFNMYALYIVGSLLEPGIGTPRFVAIYVASLLAGSFGALLLSADTHTVGASGAIFGIFAAAFVVARGRRLEGVAAQLGFLLLINFAFTFSIPGISIGGHLFGAAGGAICAVAIAAGDRGMLGANRMAAEFGACAAVAVAAVVGSLLVV